VAAAVSATVKTFCRRHAGLDRRSAPALIDNFWPLRYSRPMRLSGRKSSFRAADRALRRPTVLLGLIGANIGCFIAQLCLGFWEPGAVRDYLAISDQGVRDAYAWQFLTATVLHIGPWHLLANVLVLCLLGRDLETILGRRHFLYLYVSGAIAGELGHLFLMPPQSLLFAASGGIAALIAGYAAVLPELELIPGALFLLPVRIKAKHVAQITFALAVVLLWVDRGPIVAHSAWVGGSVAGWLYAHLLGFGRPSLLQRFLRERREEARRYERMTVAELITQEIDPLLEKISKRGIHSLSRNERHSLAKARERILDQQR
jgi:membrane associated rhomboid family serine protease